RSTRTAAIRRRKRCSRRPVAPACRSARPCPGSGRPGGSPASPTASRRRRRRPGETAMSAARPTWRRAFDRAERTVGEPLEGLVASPRYVDLTLLVRRVRGTAGTVVGFPMTTLRSVLNVPARGDIRRLGQQIAALTNEVHDLKADI